MKAPHPFEVANDSRRVVAGAIVDHDDLAIAVVLCGHGRERVAQERAWSRHGMTTETSRSGAVGLIEVRRGSSGGAS